jgi:hypothetical protein
MGQNCGSRHGQVLNLGAAVGTDKTPGESPRGSCIVVPKGGFEPPRALSPLRPERSASTSSTTSARAQKVREEMRPSQAICCFSRTPCLHCSYEI